ncbi:MAG TPA: hypothetical protein VIO94_05355, partial [Phenylobacterium sp.]
MVWSFDVGGAAETPAMSLVCVFAHFDDEYAALPLLLEAQRAGHDLRLLYLADYADPAAARRRFAETCAFLQHMGLDP